MMKKLLLLLLIALTSINFTFSQDCDYKLNEQSGFDGVHMITNSKIVDNKGKDVYLLLDNQGANYTLTMKYVEGSKKGNNWFCSQYDPLIFMFSDGSKLTLEPNKQYKTVFNRMERGAAAFLGQFAAFGNKFVFSPTYIIDKSALKELETKTVSKFRITATGKDLNTLKEIKNIEFDVNEKEAKIINENSSCIVKGDNSVNTIPTDFPLNEKTNKISYEGVIEIEGLTKDEIYKRAKEWMIEYYKSKSLITDNKERGKISQNGSFTKLFKKDNNKKNMEANEFIYYITILIKEGKFKYVLTDFNIEAKNEKIAMEQVQELLESRPAKKKEAVTKVHEGVTDVIKSMENSIKNQKSSADDW